MVSTQTYSVGKHSLGEEVPIDTIHHTIEKGSKVKPTSFHNLPPTSFDLTEEEGPFQNDFSTYFNKNYEPFLQKELKVTDGEDSFASVVR